MLIGLSGHKGTGKDTVARIIQILTAQPDALDKYTEEELTGDLLISKVWDSPVFVTKSFAEKLKRFVASILDVSMTELERLKRENEPLPEIWWHYRIAGKIYRRGHFKGKDHDMAEDRYLVKTTVRHLLQWVGTEAGRDIIHPDVWINALFSGYREQYVTGHTLVDPGVFEDDDYEEDWSKALPNWIITDVRFPNELKAIKERDGIIIRIEGPERDLEGNELEAKEDLHESETALDGHDWSHEYTLYNTEGLLILINNVRVILKYLDLLPGNGKATPNMRPPNCC